MNQLNKNHLTERMREAVEELKQLITERFPQAVFVVEEGFDPEGVYLVTTVDIADTDEVIAVVGDRLVELQVNEGGLDHRIGHFIHSSPQQSVRDDRVIYLKSIL
jgi:hypothetical protein